MFIISFYGCNTQDVKSNLKKLMVVDKTAPKLNIDREVHSDKLVVVLNSTENGTLVYENDCKAKKQNINAGNNIIEFENLKNGFYDFCTISVIDKAGNQSDTVKISPFVINKENDSLLHEVIQITQVTHDDTPSYTFRSSIDGYIKYFGSCKGSEDIAKIGNNIITFEKLENGFYDDCMISVESFDKTKSEEIKIPSFTVDTTKDFILHDSVVTKRLSTMDEKADESSGLIYINGKLYIHNDSGDKPYVYEIDSYGKVMRTIEIKGATNIDWEGMTQDESYIYIADIGNNLGDRKDLKIYKINKSDFLSNNSVDSEVINFSYADQTRFDYPPFTTPFDAESIMAYRDKLYIFTKNWLDKSTKIYPVSKEAGSYKIYSTQSYTHDFLITDVTYHKQSNKIIIIGYNSFLMTDQKIVILENFESDDFFSGDMHELEIKSPSIGFKQIEAVTNDEAEKIYVISEAISNKYLGNHPSSLFEIKIFQ